MSISPKSRKAKGRVFQQVVRDRLRTIGNVLDIKPEEIESRQMGGAGLDIILSPAAKAALGNLQIECKKQETLNVIATYIKHANRYKDEEGVKLLIHTRNSHPKKPIPVLVTMDLDTYIRMLVQSSAVELGMMSVRARHDKLNAELQTAKEELLQRISE